VLAPLGTALWWAAGFAHGPLRRTADGQVPAFIAVESGTGDRSRALVLTGDGSGGAVHYVLVRGAGLTLGQAEGTVDSGGSTKDAVTKLVGSLLAGSGADQAGALAGYGVGYVVVKDPLTARVRDQLDTTPGLVRLSQDNGTAIWQVTGVPATRAVITAPNALPVAVPSGGEAVHTAVPAGPAGRVLRLAEQADPQWHATLNGTALTPVTVDGWAQGFQLPADAGTLAVTRTVPLAHTGWIGGQLLLGVVILVLALPGRRSTKDDDLPEEVVAAAALAAQAQAQAPVPGSRRARRMAERGEGGEEPGEDDEPGIYGGGAGIPAQADGEAYPAEQPVPHQDPYAQDGYAEADYQQADPYGYDPYAAQQSYQGYPAAQPEPAQYTGYSEQPQYGEQGQYAEPGQYVEQGQYAEQPYAEQPYPGADPYGTPYPGDPYATGYGYQQPGYQGHGEPQPWLPGQSGPYDPQDPGYGGHPHHDGADPR
jgi:hypothetical protein